MLSTNGNGGHVVNVQPPKHFDYGTRAAAIMAVAATSANDPDTRERVRAIVGDEVPLEFCWACLQYAIRAEPRLRTDAAHNRALNELDLLYASHRVLEGTHD